MKISRDMKLPVLALVNGIISDKLTWSSYLSHVPSTQETKHAQRFRHF